MCKTAIAIFFLLFFSGCDQDRLAHIEGRQEELRQSNKELKQQYQQKLAELEKGIKNVNEMKDEWRIFEKSYTPKVRNELNLNVKSSEKSLKKISKCYSDCEDVLGKMRKLSYDCEALQEKVAQYEKEARKDNVIQQLRNERQEMLDNAKNSATDAAYCKDAAKKIQNSVEESRKNAEKAQKDSNYAKAQAKQAAKDSARVEQFSEKIEENRKKLQKLYRLEKKIIDLQREVEILENSLDKK